MTTNTENRLPELPWQHYVKKGSTYLWRSRLLYQLGQSQIGNLPDPLPDVFDAKEPRRLSHQRAREILNRQTLVNYYNSYDFSQSLIRAAWTAKPFDSFSKPGSLAKNLEWLKDQFSLSRPNNEGLILFGWIVRNKIVHIGGRVDKRWPRAILNHKKNHPGKPVPEIWEGLETQAAHRRIPVSEEVLDQLYLAMQSIFSDIEKHPEFANRK